MPKILAGLRRGLRILTFRIKTQGVRTTLTWMYARGFPKITGIPLLAYSQITPQVLVGPQFGSRGLRKLERLGVTGCVDLRIEFDDAEHGLALGRYCYLPTVDDAAPSLEHLERGVAFIKEVTGAGGKVYIHCAGGVGRAPTMAAAYFIAEGLSCDQAIALIKATRPFISIMPPQLEQLTRFAEMLAQRSNQTPQASDISSIRDA